MANASLVLIPAAAGMRGLEGGVAVMVVIPLMCQGEQFQQDVPQLIQQGDGKEGLERDTEFAHFELPRHVHPLLVVQQTACCCRRRYRVVVCVLLHTASTGSKDSPFVRRGCYHVHLIMQAAV